MVWNLHHAIIATLAYSHLFDYPLTRVEISRWLIANSFQSIRLYDVEGISHVSRYKTYYGLVSQEALKMMVKNRKKREVISKKKYHLAQTAAKVLKKIPTILLIGVSGGLAMRNADEDDDIDFFIIALPNTVWITRFMILCVLELIGRRRKVGVQNVADTICVNMLIDSHHLALPIEERDVYSAHEVLQMVPVVQQGDIYLQFLQANSWVKDYLYNAWLEKQKIENFKVQTGEIRRKSSLFLNVYRYFFFILEFFVKYFQLWYMRKRRTTEKISNGVIRFHPKDMRIFIRRTYLKLLKKYNIPLDRRFFQSLK